MSLVFSRAVPAAVFWATYLVFIAVDASLVTKALRGRTAPQTVDAALGPAHRPVGVLWVVTAEAIGLAFALLGVFLLPWRRALLIVGLVLAWAGIALRWWAKRTLGRFFVAAIVIQPGHRVVREGPYALIRHPGYAGLVVALLGLGTATGSAAAIAMLGGVSLAVVVRTIVIEETVLRQELGDEYVDYTRATARLLPGVW
jgi:protein-S-isoprenylcysteine O-methyltransferase